MVGEFLFKCLLALAIFMVLAAAFHFLGLV